MSLQSIPDDQHLLADGGRQCFQEFDDLRALDRTGEQAEIKPEVTEPRNRRELFPARPVLQNGYLPSRSPGARATGTFGQARFVDLRYAQRKSTRSDTSPTTRVTPICSSR